MNQYLRRARYLRGQSIVKCYCQEEHDKVMDQAHQHSITVVKRNDWLWTSAIGLMLYRHACWCGDERARSKKGSAVVNAMMLEDTRLEQSEKLEEHEAFRSRSEREHRLESICDKDWSMLDSNEESFSQFHLNSVEHWFSWRCFQPQWSRQPSLQRNQVLYQNDKSLVFQTSV